MLSTHKTTNINLKEKFLKIFCINKTNLHSAIFSIKEKISKLNTQGLISDTRGEAKIEWTLLSILLIAVIIILILILLHFVITLTNQIDSSWPAVETPLPSNWRIP